MYNIQLTATNLRRALANIELLFKNTWKVDGGFAFFSSKANNNGVSEYVLEMNYSPINNIFYDQNIDNYVKSYFPKLNTSQRKSLATKIKKLTSQGRSYKALYHAKQSKNELQSFNHHKIKIFHGLGSREFNTIIDKILKNVPLSENEINDLDLFFLKEGVRRFLKIPLPFLSTPTILLVINDIYDNDYDRAKLIRLVYYSTREALYNYIYNILVNNLQGLLSENAINSKDSLVISFVKEVCKVLLPVRLSIVKQKEQIYSVNYINEWQICDITCNSSFDIVLKTEEGENDFVNYKATFFLTSFHFPIKEQEINLDGIIVKDGYTSQWMHMMPGYELFKEQTQLMLENIFSLIYKQWNKNREAKDHATKSATSRIINRNYAHHIGSHVSHRATADKIYERVFGNYDLKIKEKDLTTTLKSIVEMENLLTRYKDERNEFISGIENNTHPVPVMFYKDIIQPFIENSLLMDNIAKSEGICWESEDPLKNDCKVKENEFSKLRIRVFYHKEIVEENEKTLNCELKDCCCEEEVQCLYKNDENKTFTDRLSFSDLGIDDNWLEMMALYNLKNETQTTDNNANKKQNDTCIHRLPYFKKLLGNDGKFYSDIDYTLPDVEVAIPGTLGSQSIYSLLENHIRNTAKHAPSSSVGSKMPVNIIIKISKRKNNETEDPDFYNMELTSNIPTIHEKSHKTKIEKALIEPIDGDTNALGFADMRINATLLAFKEIKQENLDTCIEEPHYYPITPINGESISFCMKLTRPCKIVFIGKDYLKFRKGKLINAGIRQFDTMKLCIETMKSNPRAFEFAVVEKGLFDESADLDLFLKSLPWRVLIPSSKEKCNKSLQVLIEQRRVAAGPNLAIKENDEPDKMLEKCWDAWLRSRWKPPYTLSMYFDNSNILEERYGSKANNLPDYTSYRFHLGTESSVVFENEKSFEVFYDRHGNFRDNINANLHKKSLFRLSWEHFDKNNPDFDLINNDNLKFPVISFSKLIESGIHKILVIDERAREAGLKSMSNFTFLGEDDETVENNPYLRFAMAARVFIADSFVINDEEVLYDTGESASTDSHKFFQVNLKSKPEKQLSFKGKLSDRIDFNTLDVFSKFDTLIIHRTMLSKVEAKKLFDILDENFPNIIITTGGGTLTYESSIMNRTRMLPFAAVKKYLLNGAIAKNCISNLI